ncbi:G-protein coupled receptor, partial [Armadillidium vulgare]
MASPTIESLCCLLSSTKFSSSLIITFDPLPYNLVSLFASLFSIVGSASQLNELRRNQRQKQQKRSGASLRTRGKSIIKCLALADCAAALGIFIRSLLWIKFNSFGALENVDVMEKSLCILLSAWIHYFYTATYIWTFIYAVDVHFGLRSVHFNPKPYHIFGWGVPLLLCLLGILTLYLPDLNCSSDVVPVVRFLPNYLSTFIPIVFVMLANPILYMASFSSVEKLLISSTGRLTQRERNIIEGLKMKFMLINIVFYCCWLPNVANGIILWSGWQRMPRTLIFIIWYLMKMLVLPFCRRRTPERSTEEVFTVINAEDESSSEQEMISLTNEIVSENTPLLQQSSSTPAKAYLYIYIYI